MPSGAERVARGPEVVIDSGNPAVVDAIAATGANAMRVLLTLDAANGMTPAGFDAVLTRAAQHDLLVWVSLFDWNAGASWAISPALGGGNLYALAAPPGCPACSRDTPASCFLSVWQRPWLKDLMAKHRGRVIIDAGQEFIDATVDRQSAAGREAWARSAIRAVEFFRGQGYTQPLEIMSSFQGRDLHAIAEWGERIRDADTVRVDGQPQTMFGWQAYVETAWWQGWQGGLLAGRTLTGPQMMERAAALPFPVQVGLTDFADGTGPDLAGHFAAAEVGKLGALWWDWKGSTIQAPSRGQAARDAVMAWLRGAVKA